MKQLVHCHFAHSLNSYQSVIIVCVTSYFKLEISTLYWCYFLNN